MNALRKVTALVCLTFLSLASSVQADQYLHSLKILMETETAEEALEQLDIYDLEPWQQASIRDDVAWRFLNEGNQEAAMSWFTNACELSEGHCSKDGLALALYNLGLYKQSAKTAKKELEGSSFEETGTRNGSQINFNYILGINTYAMDEKSWACTYWERSYLAAVSMHSAQKSYGLKALNKLKKHCQ